ncbi:MAG: YihY/virulence factor BrkB family protein [Acidobacteria bacterium]|nr:MAG: YihY/virulence factor BrkB family protein [Acidobacteriota bacterium]
MTWGRVLKAAGMAASRDGLLNWAAALAYYFFFSLFPAILLLAALLHAFQLQHLTNNVIAALGQNLPRGAAQLISNQMQGLLAHHVPGLLSVDIVLLFLAAGQGFAGLMAALNAAYEVREGRKFLHQMWLQFALTLSAGLLVVLALAVIILGRHTLTILAGPVHLSHVLVAVWPVIRWVIVVVFMAVALWLLYRFTPNVAPQDAGLVPAVATAIVIWLIASVVLAFYINNFGNYSAVYGSLGAVIGLMLWFYVIALAILFGAEVHAQWLRAHGIKPTPHKPPKAA